MVFTGANDKPSAVNSQDLRFNTRSTIPINEAKTGYLTVNGTKEAAAENLSESRRNAAGKRQYANKMSLSIIWVPARTTTAIQRFCRQIFDIVAGG